MEKAVVVRGRLMGLRHIDLDEPVIGIEGEVEVVLRPLPGRAEPGQEDIFDFIARLSPGNRSKEEIGRQIREEREGWGER